MPSAWLKGQLGSTCPQLPSETRWKGQLICLDSCLTNRTYYINFIQDHPDEGDRTIVQKIMDMNMFQQVRDLANMLCPVTTALDLEQSDKTTIADACNIFMNLLNESVLQDHRNKVQKRFAFVIKPCHLVAYMFLPKYLSAWLTLEQIETVKEWLICKDEAFRPAAIAFQAEATPFPASFFTTRGRASNPVTWWKALGSSLTGLPHSLINLMVAHLQRVFSSFGLVLTKLRNKLGFQKVAKLVFISVSWTF